MTTTFETATTRTIDIGTVDRDLTTGRFQKTYTLSYETRDKNTGEPVTFVRHLPAKGIEIVGKTVARAVERDIVWNVYVLDINSTVYDVMHDVTFDFKCFQDCPWEANG
jgi:hypothetical protein